MLCLTLVLFFPGFSYAKSSKVLVIESYHAEYPWSQSYREGLESTLGPDYQLEYFEMDTKRLPQKQHLRKAEAAWESFLKTKPDLVVLADDNATRYLGPILALQSIPVVYLGLNNNPRDYSVYGAKNITGVLERPLIKRAIASAGSIFTPRPRQALLLLDNSKTSLAIFQDLAQGNPSPTFSQIRVDIRLVGEWNSWKQLVLESKKNNYDLLFVGLYHTLLDQNNRHIPAGEVLRWTSEHTPIPPLGLWEFSVGKDKTIGGLVLYGKEQGVEAARLIQQILNQGGSPGQIRPVTAQKGHFLFSKTQLTKWHVKLPDKIEKKSNWVE
ncbi:ABC transporter substrate-binding protein [Dongshaea marina]|uniref:ABC transporter substrate-binding protein n=1 Tax=Dongshaea marina TaxID=2047966 RepID=UPI000D3EA45E|nr:sugar ABC transporter [Dongshaea marina]